MTGRPSPVGGAGKRIDAARAVSDRQTINVTTYLSYYPPLTCDKKAQPDWHSAVAVRAALVVARLASIAWAVRGRGKKRERGHI